MNIQLSDHFTYKKLLKFTVSPIIMMIFTSVYGVVDGYFVSNFAGKTEFAAVNFIMPFLMILGASGFMFGTGGSALIAKNLGEKKIDSAQKIFSMIVYVSVALGIVLAVLGILFARSIALWLGADGEMLDSCELYARIILCALPAFILQYEFQSFFVTAEKPQLGLFVTLAAGCTNMILDALLVAVFHFGIAGAALATALSQVVGGCVPLVYFARNNSSLLKLTKTHFDPNALFKTCINGSSELMSNISMSVVSMLYNLQLMKYAGENGVAAYGVLMYVNFIFISAFIGYSVGTAPVISYNYGSQNHSELKSVLKKSVVIISVLAVCMFTLAEVFSHTFAKIFVGYDETLMNLTAEGFVISSFSFLLSGFAVYGSSFFTALNDGLTSALISFLRTLVFQVSAVLILPLIFGINGIWFSIVAAEAVAVVVTVLFVWFKRNKYHYL